MIRDIRETGDSEIVTAHGPKFDVQRVVDLGFRVIRVLVRRILMAYPETRPVAWLPDFGEFYLDDQLYPLLKIECLVQAGQLEVSDFRVRILLERQVIIFQPFGGCYLEWTENGYQDYAGCSAEMTDIAPLISVTGRIKTSHLGKLDGLRLLRNILTPDDEGLTPLRQPPSDEELEVGNISSFFLDDNDTKLVRNTLRSFKHEGIEVDDRGSCFFVRFPHEHFGAGEGRIRIRAISHDA